jgi:intein/homing endonuclease
MKTDFSQLTESDITYIKENFPNYGVKYCADQLNIKRSVLDYLIYKKLNLTLTQEIKNKILFNNKKRFLQTNYLYNVESDQFINIKTKEVAYILGLIWADGYIYKFKNREKRIISISLVTEDMNDLLDIFNRTGKWNIHIRNRKNRKQTSQLSTCNSNIANFLIEKKYISKGTDSACEILNSIPENLKYYWFRGLFDGDGCFSIDKQKRKRVTIASSYEQDWSYLTKLLDKLEIKYSIYKTINKKNHKQSSVLIQNKDGCEKFLNYIYQDYQNDLIGLKRKYQKYKNMFLKEMI